MEERHLEIADQNPVSEPADANRFETVDYVRELFLLSAQQQKTEKKKVRLLRACVALLSVVAAALLLAFAVALPAAARLSGELSQTLQAVQDADIAALASDIASFTDEAGQALAAVSDAAGSLDELDIESLNLAIEGLGGAVDSLSAIDVEKLNTAISNLNDTVEPFANFFDKFR